MLNRGRIPLNAEETAAVEELLDAHPDASASMTRTETGETGPVRVEIADAAWLVHEDGTTEKVS